MIRLALPCLSFLVLSGCIRTQNYHPAGTKSVFYYHFDSTDKRYGVRYFKDSTAWEAYIEFDARGNMYRDRDNKPLQRDAALDLINGLRHRNGPNTPDAPVALYVFVHGWKNNASESRATSGVSAACYP